MCLHIVQHPHLLRNFLTITGEAILTEDGKVVDPGVIATVFMMVVPAGTFSIVVEEGGIFCVAAAAAAKAAMPLI